MSFGDSHEWKFRLFLVLLILVFTLGWYTCQNLVRDPYAKCRDYCEGQKDKLTSWDPKTFPVECYCYKDVLENWERRFDDKLQKR